MKPFKKKKVIIGITGASGSIYGKLLLEKLALLKDQIDEVAVIFSENGLKVWKYELEEDLVLPKGNINYSNNDLFAPPASGSAGYACMIICPCSMATLGRIASGISTDLITRAADVILKERRSLILVTREMPFSLIHIRNMETITLAGGIICPASPAFYAKPANIEDAALSVIEKILSLTHFETDGYKWGG